MKFLKELNEEIHNQYTELQNLRRKLPNKKGKTDYYEIERLINHQGYYMLDIIHEFNRIYDLQENIDSMLKKEVDNILVGVYEMINNPYSRI